MFIYMQRLLLELIILLLFSLWNVLTCHLLSALTRLLSHLRNCVGCVHVCAVVRAVTQHAKIRHIKLH